MYPSPSSTESSTTGSSRENMQIILVPMVQQARTYVPDDDWTGKSNPSERRKRQNRLNQREFRRRKDAAARRARNGQAKPSDTPSGQADAASDSGLWQIFHAAEQHSGLDTTALIHIASMCLPTKTTTVSNPRILSEFKKWTRSSGIMGSPATDQLIMLAKFNVFRALVVNSHTLGFTAEHHLPPQAKSPFTYTPENPHALLQIPSSLHPTPLQRRIPHHPWIDLLPIPHMRDNLLRRTGTYDGDQLCADLVGYFNSSTSRTGMVIWGDPWDAAGWEVTPQFLERWGWTIKGCWVLFESTNRWRAKRGERPLKFDYLMRRDGI